MQDYTSINVKLLDKVVADGDLNWFSKWLSIKCFYSNGVIYDYSDRKFGLLLGVGLHTARGWKQQFLKRGWCEVTPQGHLKFLPQHTIINNYTGETRKRFNKLEVKYGAKSLAWGDLYDKICLEVIHNKKKQTDYVRSSKKDDFKIAGVESSVRDQKRVLVLSYKSISSMLGVSKSTAFNIIKRLQAKGWIGKFNVKVKVHNGIVPFDMDSSRVFSNSNGVFIQMNNRYVFTDACEKSYLKGRKDIVRKDNKVIVNNPIYGLDNY